MSRPLRSRRAVGDLAICWTGHANDLLDIAAIMASGRAHGTGFGRATRQSAQQPQLGLDHAARRAEI